MKGEDRADYGTEIIKKLSKELKEEYGKGFDSRNLYYFLNFYKTFPNILNAVSSKSKTLLSWTHYRTLFKEPVIEEMKKVNENQYLMNRLEFVKNPVIAEFLGYSLDSEFTETELETSIINNLQKFLIVLYN